jgi:crossover junction endodeoxyribonuclease RuvC
MSKIYIGIDPGKTGGVAAILEETVIVTPMILAGKDVDVGAMVDFLVKNIYLKSTAGKPCNAIACIEKVHSMPEQGVVSSFKFGFVTGVMHGIIRTLRIPLHTVTPQAWKKVILAGTLKDKDAAIDFCRRVYPNVNLLATERSRVPHSGIADALCIAKYAQEIL